MTPQGIEELDICYAYITHWIGKNAHEVIRAYDLEAVDLAMKEAGAEHELGGVLSAVLGTGLFIGLHLGKADRNMAKRILASAFDNMPLDVYRENEAMAHTMIHNIKNPS